MIWKLDEIRKQKEIEFVETLDLKEDLLSRNPDIIDISEVELSGTVKFDSGLYDVFAFAKYDITLPSSRSLEPVLLHKEIEIIESYTEDSSVVDENEETLILSLESDEISLSAAVADNILLEIPFQVLTEAEEKGESNLPHGNAWQVLSEEEYQKMQEDKKKEASPFASLGSLLDEGEDKK